MYCGKCSRTTGKQDTKKSGSKTLIFVVGGQCFLLIFPSFRRRKRCRFPLLFCSDYSCNTSGETLFIFTDLLSWRYNSKYFDQTFLGPCFSGTECWHTSTEKNHKNSQRSQSDQVLEHIKTIPFDLRNKPRTPDPRRGPAHSLPPLCWWENWGFWALGQGSTAAGGLARAGWSAAISRRWKWEAPAKRGWEPLKARRVIPTSNIQGHCHTHIQAPGRQRGPRTHNTWKVFNVLMQDHAHRPSPITYTISSKIGTNVSLKFLGQASQQWWKVRRGEKVILQNCLLLISDANSRCRLFRILSF